MEELLPRSKDRCFFVLKHFGFSSCLVFLAVCDLHGKFPVTILMPFNKKIRAELLA